MSQPIQFESNIALINYPKQAAFGCTLPKNRIYKHSGANAGLRDLFIEQVELIVWRYKLVPEMINLPTRPGIPELQIFSIQLRALELSLDVLHCIDGAVQFPIIFKLSLDSRAKVIATYKHPNKPDASRWVLSSCFAMAWLPSDSERAAVPLALDLGSLCKQVLHRLIPMPARPQEGLAGLVAHVKMVAAKRRKVGRAASRFAKEEQFNRKVETNAQLRQFKSELEKLTGRENV